MLLNNQEITEEIKEEIKKYLETNDNENTMGASLVAQWLRIACQGRGHGFEPWSGKIPHAVEQLTPCATTTEPVL